MEDDPGQADPDVAIEEFLLGRSRRRVVVQASALDVATIALGGAVVDGEEQRPVGGKPVEGVAEQQAREEVGVASQGRQEIVVSREAVADVGGTEPTGDGAATFGEEGTQEQNGQSPGMSLVQEEGHVGEQILPDQGKEGKIHSGSPGWGRRRRWARGKTARVIA
jgi:hypothetical protein